ncbi:hypothetical protein GCM10027321_19890 [Massilia terrae]|uniref:DUF7931 domain-containing protein n=1 Tax=Massilia terrae TaxID=1811224 RepID=A0ABT2CVL1_9BURK|nr:hypothetical protein [Massilia terrae]MCS0658005.1 hypothetical protein [Massilia terrae]
MSDTILLPFSSRADCQAQFAAVLARARSTLQLFDPDCAIFPLGDSSTDAALRAVLAGGGRLQLAVHTTSYIERHYPRFLRLLRDYAHRIECRVTSRSLHQLTDSFCVADGIHIVRRFHSEHFRGEAAFDAPEATELPLERFAAIWEESNVALHTSTTGL